MKDNNEISYAVCTEASDCNFPYVRTMLKSLLKHDRWLKDNIVIFTCKLTPLSDHNRSILKEMLPNVKFKNIRSNAYSELKAKEYEKKEVLLNLYKLEVFKLKDVDLVLYINSYSLVISTLTKLFEGESAAILPKLDTSFVNPKISTKPAISSSVMMISKECLDRANYTQILDHLKNQKNVNRKIIDESIYSILSGYTVNHWENQVVKKSKYVDSKYKQFLAIQDSVSIIHMDIELNISLKKSSHFMFKKINSLWKQYNENDSWSFNNVENINRETKIKSILEKNKTYNYKEIFVESVKDNYNVKYPTKFLVLVPVHERYNVLKLFAQGIDSLKNKGYDIQVLAVGSSDSDLKSCKEFNFNYVQYKNILGEKLNYALDFSKKFDFEAMIMLGSDDLLNDKALDFYIERLRKGDRFIGFLDCYFYDLDTSNLIKWGGYTDENKYGKVRKGEPIGAWRCFSRSLLEEMDWKLWKNTHTGIDATMWEKIKRKKNVKTYYMPNNVMVCDFKTSKNITSFKKIQHLNMTKINLKSLNLFNDDSLLKEIHSFKKK